MESGNITYGPTIRPQMHHLIIDATTIGYLDDSGVQSIKQVGNKIYHMFYLSQEKDRIRTSANCRFYCDKWTFELSGFELLFYLISFKRLFLATMNLMNMQKQRDVIKFRNFRFNFCRCFGTFL